MCLMSSILNKYTRDVNHRGDVLTKWKIKQYINVIGDLIQLISIEVNYPIELLIV